MKIVDAETGKATNLQHVSLLVEAAFTPWYEERIATFRQEMQRVQQQLATAGVAGGPTGDIFGKVAYGALREIYQRLADDVIKAYTADGWLIPYTLTDVQEIAQQRIDFADSFIIVRHQLDHNLRPHMPGGFAEMASAIFVAGDSLGKRTMDAQLQHFTAMSHRDFRLALRGAWKYVATAIGGALLAHINTFWDWIRSLIAAH
jgi:hypothetical protein